MKKVLYLILLVGLGHIAFGWGPAFNVSPLTGDAPLEVTFDYTISPADAADIESILWSEPINGIAQTQKTFTYTFTTPGVYTVTLASECRPASGRCNDLEKSQTITIVVTEKGKITADFIQDITRCNAPMTVNFTDQSLNNPDAWAWEFGDGGNSTDQNPVYVYTTAGTYTVKLTSSRSDNSLTSGVKEVTALIEVLPPFVPKLSSNLDVIDLNTAGEQFEFTDETEGEPDTWEWDFGDGTGTSTLQNPTYRYSATGTYTVTLKVSNDCGSTGQITKEVTVVQIPNSVKSYNENIVVAQIEGANLITINNLNNSSITIDVYDMQGNFIGNVVNKANFNGNFNFTHNLTTLSTGLYLYNVRLNNTNNTIKFVR